VAKVEPTKGKLEEDELEKDVTATALEEPVPALASPNLPHLS
jgi:hypothetical protein